ncbi:Lrp/AsnC ligand binding domain-containing protein [Pseudomonas abieticivorans]|uniref:Lrp/AsnC ligand binding domain-containing protein n=1 Tax=Pseudomonas abieticivorans TaxID=2931382 RepID=UPI0034DB1536
MKLVIRDIDHFQSFLAETLGPVLGIKSLRSSFVLRTVVDRTDLPLIDVLVRSASDI